MAHTSTVTVFRYASAKYGFVPYGGLSPANIIPTRNVSGITFLNSNDRYQVIACSYGGSLETPPEFRYWNAMPPAWSEELANTDYLPPWYSSDEDMTVPVGSIEFPFRRLKAPQEMLVKGVIVEFVPRPSSITSESIPSSTTCGFTVFVEGQAVPDYERAGAGGTSGIVVSDTQGFSETVEDQASEPWPNIRTVTFHTRIQQRCIAARVVLQQVKLVEILSVNIVGSTNMPGRTQ